MNTYLEKLTVVDTEVVNLQQNVFAKIQTELENITHKIIINWLLFLSNKLLLEKVEKDKLKLTRNNRSCKLKLLNEQK